MTILLVSTGRRHVPFTEPSGYLYSIDFGRRKILRLTRPIEPVYREFDDNPRGGLRGCRGMAISSSEIAVSNSSVVFRYDTGWNLVGTISHPSCAGIHDILYQGDSIWVTATRADLLMQFTRSGQLIRYYYMRLPSPALEAINWKAPVLLHPSDIEEGKMDLRNPKTHDREAHNRTHINGLCLLPNGEILASLGLLASDLHMNLIRAKVFLSKIGIWDYLLKINNGFQRLIRGSNKNQRRLVVQPVKGSSAVLKVDSQQNHTLVLFLKGMTVPSHSLLTLPDGSIIYLNTTEGKAIHFGIREEEILSATKVTDGFLRGVAYIGENNVVLGSNQEILLFDLQDRKVFDKIKITDDLNESIYDIKILPNDFSLPPISLEEHFLNSMGYDPSEIVLKRRNYHR